jgi:sterol 3beta-glucosyltransferase
MQGTAVAADTIDGDLYFLGRAPHASLFPRCAAVVHHGGAGTTHSATRAGVPSVTVAFVNEQQSWGRRLQQCGAALAPLSFRTVTPDALATRIVQTAANPRLREHAQMVGAQMRAEDGVAESIRLIEQVGTRRP